jgi:hypothetical protein
MNARADWAVVNSCRPEALVRGLSDEPVARPAPLQYGRRPLASLR